MKKLKTIVIVLSGVLLVACSPRVNQPPPLSELEPPLEESAVAGTGEGPAMYDDANAQNIDQWGGMSGDQGLASRPHDGDWRSDANLETVYFEYNRYEVSDLGRRTLLSNAEYLRAHPNSRVLIEGHCDERGTEEFNQALGENRALAAREYLIQLGISPSRVDIISYGEQRPVVEGRGEGSWSKNRRAEFKTAG
jgi:peptidoglycan-associated lipoprotein